MKSSKKRRFKTLFFKLYMTHLLITMIILVITVPLSFGLIFQNAVRTQRDSIIASLNSSNQYILQNIRGEISSNTLLDRLSVKASERRSCIIIFAENGEVWLSVSGNAEIEKSVGNMQGEMSELFEKAQTGNIGYYFDAKKEYLIVSSPILVGSGFAGASFEITDISPYIANARQARNQIFKSGLIALIISLLIIFAVAYTIQRPLKSIERAAHEMASGNFDARAKVMDKTEIGKLAVSFNTMCDELQKNELQRSTFVANVSHELRSPMTSIQGMVQGVLDGTVPEDEKEQYLQIVLDETKRLNMLVNDLLEISRIESGKFPLKLEKLDICELLCRVLFTFETRIDDKNIEVEANLPDDKIFVNADHDRIVQVISNLIDNAIKFSPVGGTLKITAVNKDGAACISINNMGEVISPEDLPYIFDRFYKADKAHTRSVKGTGLGLFLVKTIITQHGGEITAESSESAGTTFTFKLRSVN